MSHTAPSAPRSVQELPRGAIIPKHGRGVLTPFPKGTIANPSGKSGLYQECLKLCRERSPDAADKMYALLKSDDERIQYMAAAWIYERAWGKPKEFDPAELARSTTLDLTKLPRELLIALLQATQLGAVKEAEPEQPAPEPPTIDQTEAVESPQE